MAAKNFVVPCFVLFFTHFFIMRSWQQALLLKIQPAVHTDQVCETHFLQLSKTTTPFFDMCMITAKRNLAFVAWRFFRHTAERRSREKNNLLAVSLPPPWLPLRSARQTATQTKWNPIWRTASLCYTFLLLCGDVMVNPSRRDKSQISPCGRFACGLCYLAVSWNDQTLCCDEYSRWFHPHL